MNLVDLAIVVPIFALVVFSVVYHLRRRKKGGCGCEGCTRNCATHGHSKSK